MTKTSRTFTALIGAVVFGALAPTLASADDAKELLKAMSDYLASQKSMSFSYQSSIEAVTEDFQKLQFTSSGTVVLERPDRLRVTRRGGFADLDVSFDGKTFTVHGKNAAMYAQVDAKGTLDDLFSEMTDEGVGAPGADLFGSNAYKTMMDGVTEATHVSSAVVNGQDCEYVVFRTPDVDWQIWIAEGPKPIPLKYVITSKHVAQAPQYTLEIADFKTGGDVAETSFSIKPPADAKKVELSELEAIDELPTATQDQGDAQ